MSPANTAFSRNLGLLTARTEFLQNFYLSGPKKCKKVEGGPRKVMSLTKKQQWAEWPTLTDNIRSSSNMEKFLKSNPWRATVAVLNINTCIEFLTDSHEVLLLKAKMRFIQDKSQIFVDALDYFQSQSAVAMTVSFACALPRVWFIFACVCGK